MHNKIVIRVIIMHNKHNTNLHNTKHYAYNHYANTVKF